MADIFGNVMIGSGFMVAVLTLIDFLLTDAQRKRLNDKALSAWVWLDDNRSVNFLDKFKDRDGQVQVSAWIHGFILVGTSISTLLSWFAGGSEWRFFAALWVGTVIAAPVAIWIVNPFLLSWITNGDKPLQYFLRSTVSVVPILFSIAMFPASSGIMLVGPDSSRFLARTPPIQAALLGAFMPTASILLYLWYINIALFLGWIISIVGFGSSRFVLQRVVEHPKGVVLGLSALAGLIGALAKSLLGK